MAENIRREMKTRPPAQVFFTVKCRNERCQPTGMEERSPDSSEWWAEYMDGDGNYYYMRSEDAYNTGKEKP